MNPLNFEQANLDYLNDLSGGNTALIREILELFLKQTPVDMEQLAAYITQEEWDNAYKQAHHIKPTLAYVGANGMREELQQIEHLAKNRQDLHTLPERFQSMVSRLETLYGELKAYLRTID